jgi:undecaprenyldiphospho-muramoylpentapeptide beta-N-acetylglucosaminyltransferase
MKKIILTGGGTSGHVTPNFALLPSLKKDGYEVAYIGSKNGIEKELVQKEGLKYYPISSGKLRRYLDLKNFTDPFRVLTGYFEARKILKKENPKAVFSKGGFVSVPVVVAAKHLGIPCIIHESDMTPGLANKLCFPSAKHICCSFPETMEYLPKEKAVCSGSPIRKELFEGDREKAKAFIGFEEEKPVLLIIGGSLGSVFINNMVRDSLDNLLKSFNIIHICGKNNLEPRLNTVKGYRQYEYVSDELKDFFAFADIIVSRAGANAICEILALKKPNILIPLSAKASRGDQILNARSYKASGFSEVLDEDDLDKTEFINTVKEVYENREKYINNMSKAKQNDAIAVIMDLINKL